MRGAGTDAEEVRVRDDAEGAVVAEDGALAVPLYLFPSGGCESRRDVDGGFEDAGLLLREPDADLGPGILVLPSRSSHGCLSSSLSLRPPPFRVFGTGFGAGIPDSKTN